MVCDASHRAGQLGKSGPLRPCHAKKSELISALKAWTEWLPLTHPGRIYISNMITSGFAQLSILLHYQVQMRRLSNWTLWGSYWDHQIIAFYSCSSKSMKSHIRNITILSTNIMCRPFKRVHQKWVPNIRLFYNIRTFKFYITNRCIFFKFLISF